MINDVVWLSFTPSNHQDRVRWDTVANAVEALAMLVGVLGTHIIDRHTSGERPSSESPLRPYLLGSPRLGSVLVPIGFEGTPALLEAARSFAAATLNADTLDEARKFLVDVSTIGSFALAILLARNGLLASVQNRAIKPETIEEKMVDRLLDGLLISEVAGTVKELYASVRYSDCDEVEIVYREYSFNLIRSEVQKEHDTDDDEVDGIDEAEVDGDPDEFAE